ncbi:GNAT family N-acetyltransferase [Undibacterium sp. LX40W]|uniref:GNAT family N-acetyltransferase n=1 Tax=Undibacterium nitidum TaxID=2762298 RepID=A0A923KNQ4_9BURK|nr:MULTISPECIES: GNAT family N-acetyltransferase [Undibacterium]MBC3880938.1 GNAT family N-acetyltransferase [Undibacterium nitidum]MBC3890329.1 GNAT family N-acetyltransferase [Undibacterium sp. LX40W]
MTSAPAFQIRHAQLEDAPGIRQLYQAVARIEGGIARVENEINEEYVQHNLSSGLSKGVCLVAVQGQDIIAEVHAYPPFPRVFAHVLSDLTIAVHPDFQGVGVGRAIFTQLLTTVREQQPHIFRVELIARESNQKAIRFYQSLGFEIEGAMKGRIRRPDGNFEADIPMAWLRT